MLSYESRYECYLRDRGMVFFKPYKKTGWPSENVRVQERALQTNKILGYSFIVENMGSRDILYEC